MHVDLGISVFFSRNLFLERGTLFLLHLPSFFFFTPETNSQQLAVLVFSLLDYLSSFPIAFSSLTVFQGISQRHSALEIHISGYVAPLNFASCFNAPNTSFVAWSCVSDTNLSALFQSSTCTLYFKIAKFISRNTELQQLGACRSWGYSGTSQLRLDSSCHQ